MAQKRLATIKGRLECQTVLVRADTTSCSNTELENGGVFIFGFFRFLIYFVFHGFWLLASVASGFCGFWLLWLLAFVAFGFRGFRGFCGFWLLWLFGFLAYPSICLYLSIYLSFFLSFGSCSPFSFSPHLCVGF